MSLTIKQIEEASFWGEGYCLKCLEKHEDIAVGESEQCDNCGAKSVISASTILALLPRLEEDRE